MDLREKPGKVQTLFEMLLRFRLIAVAAMVIATVSLMATHWQDVVSLPLAASEAFGMWQVEVESVQGVWQSARYVLVSAVACFVMFLVFGGIRGGVASLISAAVSVGALLLLDGSEMMILPMMGVVALLSLVLILFAKLSVACGLFPFLISWVFLCAIFAVLPQSVEPAWLLWAELSAFGFAAAMALSVVAGKHLGAGVPQAGALVKAAKQLLAPVLVGSMLLVASVGFDISNKEAAANIPGMLLYFAVFNVWFFALVFPTFSFAPWDRLRSGNRRVEMKDKKKSTSKSKKKK